MEGVTTYHKSEVFSFSALSGEAKSKVYNQHEALLFKQIQGMIKAYKKIGIHKRVNNKAFIKEIKRLAGSFNEIVYNNCASGLYLSDGYKLNRSFIMIN